mmetsp:Transcript_3702/g.10581  ORF Transcript_3702/g.10581 Transcript_3702/m.10581 type:complete len:288 (+) Transcript_3702:428-1291(+)
MMWQRFARSSRALAAVGLAGGAMVVTRHWVQESGERNRTRIVSPEVLVPKALRIVMASCEGAGAVHTAPDILKAALDVWKATDGIAMLFTASEDGRLGPNGRPVSIHLTPKLVKSSDASSANWCDRLWIATNVHTEKVAELNKDPKCSIGAYDRSGNYFVMQGEVCSVVRRSDGPFYKAVHEGIWKENWVLWNFFQSGPNDERFVLLEFIPRKISLVSTKFAINAESNSWRPAKLVRDVRPESGSGPRSPRAKGGVDLGEWRVAEVAREERLKRLRGNFDVRGKPIT